ncbi:hypothetical protein EI42_02568 [Thermosporothrix hazakensis]|jgi:transcriptional regulator with XRE-family HTH domain|uniref:Uncharacterized protein n=1 Tax=Thermosporothrix hazakensis TaxID=644383 RepID=A0A326U8Y0_THEHA|nr:hypothetical protein [Thermosporothrix hazakensis]PZW30596.1 hypothetical protein EI42_02568 [Thermosporothrix hazakensis]GCE49458.1 hypothetical protein KTH_43270 [Thermosporothrix hazakensis]
MKQEEHRIIAHVIGEGVAPSLADSLARYPEHSESLADTIAYYQTFEQSLPTETAPEPLSSLSQRAFRRALSRVSGPLTSLLIDGITVEQLAKRLDLGVDVVIWLERRQVEDLPALLYQRLAQALQQPPERIRAFFTTPERQSIRQQVAERAESYGIKKTFRALLQASQTMTSAQKAWWLARLEEVESDT